MSEYGYVIFSDGIDTEKDEGFDAVDVAVHYCQERIEDMEAHGRGIYSWIVYNVDTDEEVEYSE